MQSEPVPTTLDAVYGDQTWRQVFGTWLGKDEFSDENLAFVEAVDAWKSAGGRAKDIYDRFVAEGSPKQVNIPDTQRGPITRAFTTAGAPSSQFFDDDVPEDIFDAARTEIWGLMQSDSFMRFLNQLGTVQHGMPALDGVPSTPGRTRAGAVDEDNDPGPLPETPDEAPEPPPNAPHESIDPNEEDEGPLPHLPHDAEAAPPPPPHDPLGDAPPPPPAEEEPALGVEAATWHAGDGQLGGGEEPMTEAEAAQLQEPVTAEGDLAYALGSGLPESEWHDAGQEHAGGDASNEWGDGGTEYWQVAPDAQAYGEHEQGYEMVEHGGHTPHHDGATEVEHEGDLVLMD